MRPVPGNNATAYLYGVMMAAPMVFALMSAPPACATPAAAATPASAGWRPIVIKGANLPQLLGCSEDHLEVLAIHQGHLAPIPFEVDEVLPDGSYALPNGPEPVHDDSLGILDRDDEVAMMLSDFGERARKPDDLPAGALEMEIAGLSDGTRRYAYIAKVPSPVRSPISYVRYEPGMDRVEGSAYRMTFSGDYPIGLMLKHAGRWSPSLIRDSKVRVTAQVLIFFTLTFGGSGVTNRLLAWRSGPVRVIRRVSHSVKLILGIRSPRVVSAEIFYRDYGEDFFVARVLWVPRVFFSDVRVHTWLDFVGLDGFTLSWPGMNEPPLKIASGDPAIEQRIAEDPPRARWLSLKGDGRMVLQTFMPSPDLDVLHPRMYYCDGTSPSAAAYDCAGPAVRIGYLLTGWENLSAGTHRLESILMVLPDSTEPDRVAAELRARPRIKIAPAIPAGS